MKKYYCIKQHDYKDCGCACLATICKSYGLKYPISKIREVAGTDKEGTSALGVIKAAEKLGFSAKGIKANKPEDIFGEIPLPAIAHVVIDNTMLHYVVIHKISEKEIIIADPAKGIVKYKPIEFFNIWTGILIIITPTSDFKKGNEVKGVFTRFFELLKPQKGLLIHIFLASILITVFGIIGSFYFKFLLDDIVPNNLKQSLTIFSIGFIVLAIFKIIMEAFRTQLLIHLGQKLDIPLMLGYYEHVINLPMSFFGTREIGEVISRFNDASNIRQAISGVALTMMIDVFMVLIGGGILYSQSPSLFGLTIIPLVIYGIIVYSFKSSIEKVNRETMEKNSKLTSYLIESLNGIETIKAFNSEREVNLETEKRFIKLIKAIFKNERINNIQVTFKRLVESIFAIIVLWIGSTQVLSGSISFGELLTFNALLAYFLDPIENIINLQPTVQTALVAAERLSEILDLELEKSEQEDKKIKPKSLKGNIEFKNIDFRYGTRNLILKNINMTIKKGERIALVGESGSGKTTLAKLLLNFYKCENGEILVNNYNLLDINVESLRDKIAYISQETFLFNGTILENLILGNPYLTYEEVIDACEKAQIHDFINSLPLRYNTLVEENGSNFSGGQKQRLSIARAILRKPEILIMDEATSNLDSITEKAIERTIHDFSEGMTTIIIAHRLSTIMRCDNIYILEKGEIKEKGNHKDLLDNKGRYYKLWKEQLPEINNIEKTQVKEVVGVEV
ncbi:bacteriocin cleavage/export ABC transporter [Paraclostridium bifermentans]|uniref:peptidase domain-containing ABC transporter n=2 Tax=Paraclostridium bifermentans TaxID=1490 RepID=UPI00038CD76C|nr:peptidase domain-containing ABC transporter [Paraclostridium bifermentans]EQK37164.1 lactococcin-G-processing and transport ATP-binding protein LagD [[Clostridium] bifermentans ATCC 19299] [Paraclostridium bifermentans ATCC 19299]MCE9676695.1 peptidase domain-containing ABC transporter [Paraclostridium bifermentans]GKZ04733.1 bacteriocin cleavage/export ABC transporter [Paraclostridium bifermentans]GKZ06987.1 bacteriocin cleavage/export ABC transporter [Paraclostridium bifermentans]GKZ11083